MNDSWTVDAFFCKKERPEISTYGSKIGIGEFPVLPIHHKQQNGDWRFVFMFTQAPGICFAGVMFRDGQRRDRFLWIPPINIPLEGPPGELVQIELLVKRETVKKIRQNSDVYIEKMRIDRESTMSVQGLNDGFASSQRI